MKKIKKISKYWPESRGGLSCYTSEFRGIAIYTVDLWPPIPIARDVTTISSTIQMTARQHSKTCEVLGLSKRS